MKSALRSPRYSFPLVQNGLHIRMLALARKHALSYVHPDSPMVYPMATDVGSPMVSTGVLEGHHSQIYQGHVFAHIL